MLKLHLICSDVLYPYRLQLIQSSIELVCRRRLMSVLTGSSVTAFVLHHIVGLEGWGIHHSYLEDIFPKADLHGAILSHATSLRHAYDTF